MNFKDDSTGGEAEDDQALWALLGKSRTRDASPYFARRLLRELESGAAPDRPGALGWLAWLHPRWVLTGSIALLVVSLGIAANSARLPVHRLQALVPSATVAARPAETVSQAADDVSPQDIEVIADLDNAEAREETNVWTDENSRL